VDTDGDGYPDSWIDGYSEDDSTTSLTLDSFVNDAACWLDEHDDGEGNCDFSATMSEFIPTAIASDVDGIVYLYSQDDFTIYRWSADEEDYLSPIYLALNSVLQNTAPEVMTYSEAHERLYLGYSSGSVTYIDLTDIADEITYAVLDDNVSHISSAGDYVILSYSSYYHTVYDVNGEIIDDSTFSASTYYNDYLGVYSDDDERFYYLRYDDLYYREIDQSNGALGDADVQNNLSVNYWGDDVYLSDDGSIIFFGSGSYYDTSDLSELGAIDSFISAAIYSDIVVTASVESSDESELTIYNTDFSSQYSISYDNEIISILQYGDLAIVISLDSDNFVFNLEDFGDSDNDQLPSWWESKYGLSDDDDTDASSDLDADSLTNLEEYLAGTDPSVSDTDDDDLTDYEEINTYSTDPLLSDTDNDSLSDGEEVNDYGTEPTNSDSDNDGFSDGSEVLTYDTDPLDIDSVPDGIGSLSESFESSLDTTLWSETDTSDADWYIDGSERSDGSFSLRSGDIDDSEYSSIELSALFAAGELSFDVLVDAESCCDRLQIYVDGELTETVRYSSEWQSFSISLSEGEHSIEFMFIKDGSVSSFSDSAYIDNVIFTAN